MFGVGALASKDVELVSEDKKNRVALSGELGFSARFLSGEIAANDVLRNRPLTTDRRFFGGLEAGMAISVNRITAALQLYHYFIRIPSIGPRQLTTGVSVQADVFTFGRPLPNESTPQSGSTLARGTR